jgi:hypothetical protein
LRSRSVEVEGDPAEHVILCNPARASESFQQLPIWGDTPHREQTFAVAGRVHIIPIGKGLLPETREISMGPAASHVEAEVIVPTSRDVPGLYSSNFGERGFSEVRNQDLT